RRLVPAEDYATASAQLHGRDMGVRVAGPSLGGLLFTLSRALPFVVDAVSYLASVVGVLLIKRPLGPDAVEQAEREPLRRAVTTGFRFLATNAFLRFGAVWAATMNVLGRGLSLLVILLLEANGHGAGVIGVTQALGSVGGIAGALVATRVIARFPGRRLVLALTWCLTAAAFAVAAFPTPVGIALAFGAVSVVAVPLNVMFATYEMQLVPDRLLGRVSTTLNLTANGLRWTAPIAVGVLVEATSARTAAVIWACAFVIPSVFVMFSHSLGLLDTPITEVRAAGAD
ncbi:MAG TPA: MFS transporter, partial [Mycobacteriales bacterium]|nr:MFS transporter [Mycobacteriales bacterium]